MCVRFPLGCVGAAAVLALSSQAAHADLTANDVWTDWKEYLSSTGYSVTGIEETSANSLTISGVTISLKETDDTGAFEFTMDSLVFAENGDGTVTITTPRSIPLTFTTIADGEGRLSGTVTYTHTDRDMIASGDPDDITYDYETASAVMELGPLTSGGAPLPPETLQMTLTMADVKAATNLKTGDLRTYTQDMTIGSLAYDLAFDDAETGDKGQISGAMQDIEADGNGTMPLEFDTTDINAYLLAGFAANGTMTYGSGNTDFQGIGEGEEFAFKSSSQGGRLGMGMDASGIDYSLEQENTSISLASAELPVPVEIASSRTAFNLSMPVRKTEDNQDFAFGLNLSEFTMSELLWSMFDPTSQLPRDPATVLLDATGKAKMLFNLFDPVEAAMMEQNGAPPAEISELNINKLLVSMVGASLNGTGEFTFDNSDMTTYPGYPRPTGFAELQLTGANALVDKLIAMGIIGTQEAMAARGMMAMIASPGDAPDTMNSRIEFTSQGQILANGLRIK